MKQKLIDQQWVDIVQPGMAQGTHMTWTLLGLGLILFAGAGYYFLYYRRPRRQLTRYIHSLHKQISTARDRKFILYQLEYRLCIYLGIASLAQREGLNTDWQAVIESVIDHRYRKQQPSSKQTEKVLQQCLQLLNTDNHRHAE